MREEGLLAVLEALLANKTIKHFVCEGQKYQVSRALLTVVGNLVCFDNNTLEILRLSANKGTLQQEIDEGDNYDSCMVEAFKKEVSHRSNIKCLTL
jgi:hypothetical protein